eukprot:scaffold1623_cov165-Ochromonas_danica.AAC.13
MEKDDTTADHSHQELSSNPYQNKMLERRGSERGSTLAELLPSKIEIIRRISGGYLLEPPPPDPELEEQLKNFSLPTFLYSCITYKAVWTFYYIVVTLVAGAIITGIDGLPYVDGYFMAASAMCGAGLSTVSMLDLSTGSFIVLAILMLIGCPAFLLMVTTSIRKWRFKLIHDKVISSFKAREATERLKLSPQDKEVIAYYRIYSDSLGTLIVIYALYGFGALLVGTLAIFGALYIKPLAEELRQRRMDRFAEAGFLSLSAFSNCGLTLTSDSLMGLDNNPTAYVFISVMVLAGNTTLPIFLRLLIKLMIKCSRPGHTRRCLLFILANPRRLTTHIFDPLQTIYLGLTVFLFCSVQYIFFLGSTLDRQQVLRYYSRNELVGIGYFQTLSTRNAGFAMMDLRLLSEGLLVIYLVMMYLSAFPFVTTMHTSEVVESEEEEEGKQGVFTGGGDAEVNQLKDEVVRRRLELDNLSEIHSDVADEVQLSYERLHGSPAGSRNSIDLPNRTSRPIIYTRTNQRESSSNLSMSDATTAIQNHHNRASSSTISSVTQSNLPRAPRHRKDSIDTLAIKLAAAEVAKKHPSRRNTIYEPIPEIIRDSKCDSEEEVDAPSSNSKSPGGQVILEQTAPDEKATIELNRAKRSYTIQPTPPQDIQAGSVRSSAALSEAALTDDGVDVGSNVTDCSERASMHSSQRDDYETVGREDIQRMNAFFAHQFLFRHTFFLLLAIIILAYSEEHMLNVDSPEQANLFYVLFEIVSAYGSVGLSLGVPGKAYSLSGAMTTLGKLVIIAVMILGKHRGLPSASDEVIDYEFHDYKSAWHYEGTTSTELEYRRKKTRRRSSKMVFLAQ